MQRNAVKVGGLQEMLCMRGGLWDVAKDEWEPLLPGMQSQPPELPGGLRSQAA